jgi:ubiquitin fusion degradation protein 1
MFWLNRQPQYFESKFRVVSAAIADKVEHLEKGGKICLPQSSLIALGRLNIQWPMLFEIRNDAAGTKTHCGVLEFSAEEGRCIMPYWMMQILALAENEVVSVRSVELKRGTFVRLQPHQHEFAMLSNPKVVLETALRNYATLTKLQDICIPYLGKRYFLRVLELEPADESGAVSIIETDMSLDLAPAMDAPKQEEARSSSSAAASSSSSSQSEAGDGSDAMPSTLTPLTKRILDGKEPVPGKRAPAPTQEEKKFEAFAGSGRTLRGRVFTASSPPSSSASSSASPAALTTSTPVTSNRQQVKRTPSPSSSFEAFAGQGRQLKRSRN